MKLLANTGATFSGIPQNVDGYGQPFDLDAQARHREAVIRSCNTVVDPIKEVIVCPSIRVAPAGHYSDKRSGV